MHAFGGFSEEINNYPTSGVGDVVNYRMSRKMLLEVSAPQQNFIKQESSGSSAAAEPELCATSNAAHMKREKIKRRKKRPPPGFLNVGNTCYANAALQCLFSTALSRALLQPKCFPAFRSYSSNGHLLYPIEDNDCEASEESFDDKADSSKQLSQLTWMRAPNKQRHKQMSELCQWITSELTHVCRLYQLQRRSGSATMDKLSSKASGSFLSSVFGIESDQSCSRVVDPSSITRNVDKLSSCLRFGQQEDSHEFLRSLLSAMTMDGFNKELSSLFDGLLESSVTCQECKHMSITRDRYMDLSLEIGDAEIVSLTQALEHFTRIELLSQENMVQCEKCETKRLVTKGLRLATSPSILVCHLKRFEYDIYGRARRINKQISFPTTLKIGSYMSLANKGQPPDYELVAMVVHQGSTCTHGHYVAYVRGGGSENSIWYRISDANVEEVSLADVLEKQAYILLYEAKGMRHHEVDGDCGSLCSVESTVTVSDNASSSMLKHSSKGARSFSAAVSPPFTRALEEQTTTTLSSFIGLFSQCGIGDSVAGLCDGPTAESPIRVPLDQEGRNPSDNRRVYDQIANKRISIAVTKGISRSGENRDTTKRSNSINTFNLDGGEDRLKSIKDDQVKGHQRKSRSLSREPEQRSIPHPLSRDYRSNRNPISSAASLRPRGWTYSSNDANQRRGSSSSPATRRGRPPKP